ncbi:hypothetical protein SAGO17_0032 [Mimivirus AB-566-O17]|uniref:Uncharacterized protein n=1 Tax=Mimivirus AB-566-O17 TaxID=1988039 RepID=A0A1X9VNP1_9VIRU|nr:hypothetical protein SAGO17_0032 [Mimivirus AB-566-O17]
MAIQNDDAYVTGQNVSITGVYMTLGCHRVLLTKDGANYNLNGICCIYKDASAYTNGFAPLGDFRVNVTLGAGDLAGNLYTALYDELKVTYTNTTDV